VLLSTFAITFTQINETSVINKYRFLQWAMWHYDICQCLRTGPIRLL